MKVPVRFMRKNRCWNDVRQTDKQKLTKAKVGDVVPIIVYDCFSGNAKLLKKGWRKYYVEITDAFMCYSCQKQMPDGARMWIYKKEIYDDDAYCHMTWREALYEIKCFFFPKFKIEEKWKDEDLPF